MLKSCKYCGRIHDSKYDCGRRPVRQKSVTDKDKFRWTKAWQDKRDKIKERDKYLCQVCIRKMPPVLRHEYLQVHHAIPLEVDFDRRLDDDNLITLCDQCHELAEGGRIPYAEIKSIIDEQEERYG